jgi:mono/diheme cytochrome c family protein
MLSKLIPIALSLTLLLAACSPAQPQPAAQAPDEAALAQGKALFATNCGECHSNDGSGSNEAPAVLGHTAEQVKAQVRNAEGAMQAIPPDKLSDADLERVAAFIASLPGEEAHPDIRPSEEERVHLEAALEAIEDYEHMTPPVAIAHLEQAVALTSGETAAFYEALVDSIQAEKAGNARHELKELLGLEDEH